jgi:protein transport protein SEC31
MQRIKSKAPPAFRAQVLDTEKRLNILFDHLNNEDLLKPDTIEEMNELARSIEARQHDQAQVLFTDIMTNKTEEGSNWMVSSSPKVLSLFVMAVLIVLANRLV